MKLLRIVALTGVWCLLTREVTGPNLLLGLALAWALVRATGRGASRSSATPSTSGRRRRALRSLARQALVRPLRGIELAGFFLVELLVSNLRIAWLILRPRIELTPRVLEVPVDATSDEELALLSDLVTLTPGTLSLDVTADGRALVVHVLSAQNPGEVVHRIRHGLGRRVGRLFR